MPRCESKEKSSRLVRVFPPEGWWLQSVYSGKILDPPSVRYNSLELTLCRSVTPPSTLSRYSHGLGKHVKHLEFSLLQIDRRGSIGLTITKSYASRSMFSNQACSSLVFGLKKLPPTIS